jgi:hypothetical protein
MNAVARTFMLSRVLITSQLRASQSDNGRSRIWERPAFILAANGLAFALAWSVSYVILGVLPTTLGSVVEVTARQVLGFMPTFVLSIVLLAGIIFELNTSSKFASSDLVNWLPIAKSEYVAASAASVAYIYSPYLCIASGLTLALSIQTHLFLAWTVSFALSVGSLFTGGFLVEILRASINRVYSAMSKKTGRATLVIRLGLTIAIIVAFQVVFNPTLLFNAMSAFVGALDASFFIPVVWPSLMVFAVIEGDVTGTAIYGSLTTGFVIFMFLVAVLVRSRYWSPTQTSISITSKHGYAPRPSRLGGMGFSEAEAAMISKDLKGYVRQKELLVFLALPFVFSAVLAMQYFTLSSNATDVSWLIAFFAGFSSVFLAGSCIGVEGRNFMNMYVVPLGAKELVRAKASSTLVISLGASLALTIVGTILFAPVLSFFLKVLVMGVGASFQSVFVGLYFATKHSEFAERPRPRYISMSGMLKAMIVGMGLLLVSIIPIILFFQSQLLVSLLISITLFSVTSVLAYRYSIKGAESLMIQMRS